MADTGNIQTEKLSGYRVWDRTTRIFHWINVLTVTCLIAIGIVILNAKALGVSDEGKIALKSLHVYVGYIFCINLLWRFIWGFSGNRFARWRAILPVGKGYWRSLGSYITGILSGHPVHYLGHNPLARIMVTFMMLLLLTQAVTGLVLAGTDLYFPPLGHEIKEWVAGSGEEHEKLRYIKPGSTENVDDRGYAEMRQFREGFIETHEIVFFLLLIAILLHIIGIVVTEFREGGGLISAMITGKKYFSDSPVDKDEENKDN